MNFITAQRRRRSKAVQTRNKVKESVSGKDFIKFKEQNEKNPNFEWSKRLLSFREFPSKTPEIIGWEMSSAGHKYTAKSDVTQCMSCGTMYQAIRNDEEEVWKEHVAQCMFVRCVGAPIWSEMASRMIRFADWSVTNADASYFRTRVTSFNTTEFLKIHPSPVTRWLLAHFGFILASPDTILCFCCKNALPFSQIERAGEFHKSGRPLFCSYAEMMGDSEHLVGKQLRENSLAYLFYFNLNTALMGTGGKSECWISRELICTDATHLWFDLLRKSLAKSENNFEIAVKEANQGLKSEIQMHKTNPLLQENIQLILRECPEVEEAQRTGSSEGKKLRQVSGFTLFFLFCDGVNRARGEKKKR
jgi:hypothetical protein